jgi:GDP-L-fucose synthase
MRDVITGENQMLNAALGRRLNVKAAVMRWGRLPLAEDVRVYFTGGKPFGSQAVRERPAEVCAALTESYVDVINACHDRGVRKMVCVLSSCIYPPSREPLKETEILGRLDPVSEPAALPRLLALRLCQYYRQQFGDHFVTAVPATIYGPGDDFGQDGHALPMLMKAFHDLKEADKKSTFCRGSADIRREWIHVDDVADALIFIMEHYDDYEPINIGVGGDIAMSSLIALLQTIIGTSIEVRWDALHGGVDRKLLSIDKLAKLGWKHQIMLGDGLEKTYEWFKASGTAGQPQRQD